MNAVNYAQNLDNDQKMSIVDDLAFYGVFLNYDAYCQNGPIRDFISRICNSLRYGTTKDEVNRAIDVYNYNVGNLRKKVENGEITPEEFAAQYKLITGNSLSEKSATTLSDSVRGNELVDINVLEEISDYKDTINGIYQVGEYIIVLGVGIITTAVTGGIAGAAYGAALSQAANLGIALTSTTCSLIAKVLLSTTRYSSSALLTLEPQFGQYLSVTRFPHLRQKFAFCIVRAYSSSELSNTSKYPLIDTCLLLL